MSEIINAEETAKVENRLRGKMIAYWVTNYGSCIRSGERGNWRYDSSMGDARDGGDIRVPRVLSDHYRDLESTWDDSHPHAGVSAT